MLDDAKKSMERILNRELDRQPFMKLFCYEEYRDLNHKIKFHDYKNDREIMFIPKEMPETINKGNTQAIIKLNDIYIAKIPIIKFKTYDMISSYPKTIIESMNTWKELGFEVQPHEFYHIESNDKISLSQEQSKEYDQPRIAITNNLQNDRYKVRTYSREAIMLLNNRKQLKEEFENGFRKIEDIYNNPDEYALQATGHMLDNGKIDEAITHMFLVQIDKETNNGKLILGDLDHLFIYKLD